MNEICGTPEGLRERKRRKTRERIVDVGFRLFAAKGFAATTIEAIAEESEVSRRTLHYYFDSKEDILVAKLSIGGELLHAAVSGATGATPFEVVCNAMMGLVSTYMTEEFLVIDELLRSTPGLQARMQAHYESQEWIVFAALRERWPEAERLLGLRVVAMISIGSVRLALDNWRNEGRQRSLLEYLSATFESAQAEI